MSQLRDFDPQYLKKDGKVFGFSFLCPCCLSERLVCTFEPSFYNDQKEAIKDLVKNVEDATWVPAGTGHFWSVNRPEDFDRITIRPEIDASIAGHWRGMISDGETQTLR